jgi:methionine synthase II (cobalamin-independent)
MASFFADTTGSYLRPPQLLEAQVKKKKGEITAEELIRVENEAVKTVVNKQVAAGLKIICDGEQRRGDFFTDFLSEFQGVRVQRTEKNVNNFRFLEFSFYLYNFLVNLEFLQKWVLLQIRRKIFGRSFYINMAYAHDKVVSDSNHKEYTAFSYLKHLKSPCPLTVVFGGISR